MDKRSKVVLILLPLLFALCLALPAPGSRPEIAPPAGDSGDPPPPPSSAPSGRATPGVLAEPGSARAPLATASRSGPASLTAGAPAPAPANRAASAVHATPETHPLRLRVLDSLGRPAPSASLEVHHVAAGEQPVVRRVATDAGGRAAVPLATGTVQVTGWTSHATGRLESFDHDPGSEPDGEHVLRLETGRSIAGQVYDALDGRPIAGAEVWIATHSELDRVVTARDGRFDHPRHPGRDTSHQVHVRAPGYGATVRVLSIREDESWQLWGTGLDAEGASGFGTPELSLALVPALEVVGRVTAADGRPLEGLPLSVEGYLEFLPGAATPDSGTCRTNADGAFSIAGLRSDVEHVLRVDVPGYAKLQRPIPGDPGTARVDLGTVTLGAECLLSALVLDPAGRPAQGLTVSIRDAAEDERRAAARAAGLVSAPGAHLQAHQEIGKTDEHGTFVFEGLPAGDYVVRVHRSRGEWLRLETHLGPAGAAESLTLDLPLEAITMSGRVSEGGVGVAGARVTVRGTGRTTVVSTDPRGWFRAAGLEDSVAYALDVVHTSPAGTSATGSVTEVFASDLPEVQLTAIEALAAR